jgi:hypothetical protein
MLKGITELFFIDPEATDLLLLQLLDQVSGSNCELFEKRKSNNHIY